MFLVNISPPYSIIWRIFNHVLLDWSNTKYSFYYFLVLFYKKKKVISSLESFNHERKRKRRSYRRSHNKNKFME